jgi:hypothetical protein
LSTRYYHTFLAKRYYNSLFGAGNYTPILFTGYYNRFLSKEYLNTLLSIGYYNTFLSAGYYSTLLFTWYHNTFLSKKNTALHSGLQMSIQYSPVYSKVRYIPVCRIPHILCGDGEPGWAANLQGLAGPQDCLHHAWYVPSYHASSLFINEFYVPSSGIPVPCFIRNSRLLASSRLSLSHHV